MMAVKLAFEMKIKNRQCSFFPGKLLDEFHRVLSLIDKREYFPPYPYKIKQLGELADLTFMALEHAGVYIFPNLKPDKKQKKARGITKLIQKQNERIAALEELVAKQSAILTGLHQIIPCYDLY